MDLNVELHNAINLQVPQDDLERIKLDVAVVKAARFHVTEGNLIALTKALKNIDSRLRLMWT